MRAKRFIMKPKYIFVWMLQYSRYSVSLHQNTFKNKIRSGELNRSILFSSSSSLDPSSYSILQSDIRLTSSKSTTVKYFQSLAKKASFRHENQMSIVEGHRIILDILMNPKTRPLMRTVLVCKEALLSDMGMKLLPILDEIHQSERVVNCDIILTTKEVVATACDTVTPQGIVGAIALPTAFAPEIIRPVRKNGRKNSLFLVLDGISDPGNLGTLLRSSLAVDIEAVILLSDCCDYSNPKAIRSAMGATFFVPICLVESWDHCLELLNRCNVPSTNIYAATMEAGIGHSSSLSEAYYDIDWISEPMALVIGKEGQGLSARVRQDVASSIIRSVHIPMEEGIESLNAAVCGSIILFEYQRQNAKNKI